MIKHSFRAALLASTLAFAPIGAHAASTADDIFQPTVDDEKQPVDRLMQLGQAAAAKHDWPTTIRYYTAAHHVAPDSVEPLFDLGLAASQVPGRELQAIGWFEAFLAVAPDDTRATSVRQQIALLEDSARAHAAHIFLFAEKAVSPLQPDNRKPAALELAKTAARLNDGDAMVKWLTQWGDDLYRIPDNYPSDLRNSYGMDVGIFFVGDFSRFVTDLKSDSPTLQRALAWEVDYLSIIAKGGPDKPKITDDDQNLILGEEIRADAKLGRTQEATALLSQLQAKYDNSTKSRASLIQLIGAKIALGKKEEAEQDLRAWYDLAMSGPFYDLRDHDGKIAIEYWRTLGNLDEAHRVIDLFQSEGIKMADQLANSDSNASPANQLQSAIANTLIREDQVDIGVMHLALDIGDLSRAMDALDQAWQAQRRAHAEIQSFGASLSRADHSTDEQELTTDFYGAVLELGRALQKAHNQDLLNQLTTDSFQRAGIEFADEEKEPQLPPLPVFDVLKTMSDEGYIRAGADSQKIDDLIDLIGLSPAMPSANLNQYFQLIRSWTPNGGYTHTVFHLANLELKTLGPSGAQNDILRGARNIERCDDKVSYLCGEGSMVNPWYDDSGNLLLLSGGEGMFNEHVRNIKNSSQWSHVRQVCSSDTEKCYTDFMRNDAKLTELDLAMDKYPSETPAQRAHAWAMYAEFGVPSKIHFDLEKLTSDAVTSSELGTGTAGWAWSTLDGEINVVEDELSFISDKST